MERLHDPEVAKAAMEMSQRDTQAIMDERGKAAGAHAIKLMVASPKKWQRIAKSSAGRGGEWGSWRPQTNARRARPENMPMYPTRRGPVRALRAPMAKSKPLPGALLVFLVKTASMRTLLTLPVLRARPVNTVTASSATLVHKAHTPRTR
jgi:hypothetical protein